MEKKRNLYRGRKNLDYETAFTDREKSMEKIKAHIRKVKEDSQKQK